MIDILLYSTQPILAAGLRVALAELPGFNELVVSTTIPELVDQIRNTPAKLILIELTREVTLELLKTIQSETRSAAIILWVDAVSIEFASQVIAAGVRGILRRQLSIELQLRCFQKVAEGELWLEKTLTDRLLTTGRVALTRRERQILGVLAQGMKNKEIAYALGISEGSVKVYLSHLLRKVGANDRLDLALFALRNMAPSGQIEVASSHPAYGIQAVPLFVPGFVCRPAA